MKRIAILLASISTLAAGILAALTLGIPTASASYSLSDLTGLGYTVYSVGEPYNGEICTYYYADGFGSPRTLIGPLDQKCDGWWLVQQRIDALVASYPPTSQDATATTSATTNETTTTTPAPTLTTPTSTEPTTADPAAPADITATTVPVVTTTMDTVAARISALEKRITALEQQLAALTTKVERLALASNASWLAYQQAIQSGDDPATAADVARGAFLNAEYGLGEFAT